MNKLIKKIQELTLRFQFEIITPDLKLNLQNELNELNEFIEETFPKIRKRDKYIIIDSPDDTPSNLNLTMLKEFEDEMVKYYPEEFI